MLYSKKLVRTTLFCYLLMVVLFATIRTLSAFGVLSFLNTFYGNLLLNILVQVVLLFGVAIFVFAVSMKTKSKSVFRFYKFRKISFKQVLISIVIGIVVYILNVLITTFFNAILSAFGYTFSSSSASNNYPVWLLFVNLFFTAVLPGICEETAHRGMLLNGLSPLGIKKALIISSLCFGLLHLNIEQAFYATLIGLLVGYMTLGTSNIIPAMIVHFMNNAISVFMGFSSVHHLGLEKGFSILSSWLVNTPYLALLFMIILIVALLLFLFFLLKKLFKDVALARMSDMQKAILHQYEREKFLREVESLTKGDASMNENELQAQFFQLFDSKYEKAKLAEINNDIDANLFQDKKGFKLDSISKVLLVTIFVIIGTITLFTFIWGLL